MLSHPISPNSLIKSILLERLRWRLLILGLSLLSAILGVVAPYAQKHFTDELLSGGNSQPWIWSAFALTFGTQLFSQLTVWLASRESFITQKSLADTSYARVMEGPGGLIGNKPAGEAVSYFAVDVPGAASILDQALVMAGSMIFPLILAPFALHAFFQISWVASLGAITCIVSINFVLAKRQSRFFYSFKQLAAERTGLVAEWVQNIRTLRILGWVKPVEKKIFKVRLKETRNRLGMVTNGQFMNTIASSGTYILNILSIILLIQMREGTNSPPTPGELLSLLWILGVFLARPLRQLPWSMVIGLDAYSSMTRLQNALQLPITQPSLSSNPVKPKTKTAALEVLGLNLEADGKTLLNNINLTVQKGEFIAIVGEVGSGKTLLLQSLMGATGARFDSFAIDGQATKGPSDPHVRSHFAFVPQEGFTMSASLRENVMFTYIDDLESKNYLASDKNVITSLKLAQFHLENERIADGLETEIGERGVNLSGGQRQRVSIARTHYVQRSIVLLDDCLSAVDVDTEKELIEQLIDGEWKGCTRILTTHRMSVLPKCDRVIFIEGGSITHEGTYQDLFDGVQTFRDFVKRGEIINEKKIETPIEVISHGK